MPEFTHMIVIFYRIIFRFIFRSIAD